MADFPGSIFTPRTVENLPGLTLDPAETANLFAEDVNLPNDEIVAIEETLGTDPQGSFDTVGEFLASLQDFDDNLLETGTFTPTVSFATPGDLSLSYLQQTGNYIRVGKLLFVSINVRFTPTYTTASGQFYITGMPGTPETTQSIYLIASSAFFTWPTGVLVLLAALNNANNRFDMLGGRSGSSFLSFTPTQLASGAQARFILSGLYEIQ